MIKRLWMGTRILPGLALPLLLAVAAAPSSSQNRTRKESAGNPLVGTWRLASLEQTGADGRPRRITCCGLLVFTPDGLMSVQVMDPNPQEQPAAGQQYSQSGYEASWGTFTAVRGTFIFHVEGALVRSLIGKDLPRYYQFSGNQLIVTSTRADEHWRAAWERY